MNWYRFSSAYYKTVLYPKVDNGKTPHYTLAQIGGYLEEIHRGLPFGQFAGVKIKGDNNATVGELELVISSRAGLDDPILSESEEAISDRWARVAHNWLRQLDVMYDIVGARTEKSLRVDDRFTTSINIEIEKNYSETERQLNDLFSKYTPYIEIPSYVLADYLLGEHMMTGKNEWPIRLMVDTLGAISRNATPETSKYIPKLTEFVEWCYKEGIQEVIGNTIVYSQEGSYPEEWIEAAAEKMTLGESGGSQKIPEWAYEIIEEELKKDNTHPAIERRLLEPFTRNKIPSLGTQWVNNWFANKMESPNPPKEITDFIDRYMQKTPDPLAWFTDYVLYKFTTDPPPAWVAAADNYFARTGHVSTILKGWFEKAFFSGQLPVSAESLTSKIMGQQTNLTDMEAELALKTLEKELVSPEGEDGVDAPMMLALDSGIRNGYVPVWARPWVNKQVKGEPFLLNSIWEFYSTNNQFPDGSDKFVLAKLLNEPDDPWSKRIINGFTSCLVEASGFNYTMAEWIVTMLSLGKFPPELEEVALETVDKQLQRNIGNGTYKTLLLKIKSLLETKGVVWDAAGAKRAERAGERGASTFSWYKT